MSTNTAPMQQLTALFSGTWHGAETLYPSPFDPAGGSATAIWTVRPAVDGFCLLVDYHEQRAGQPPYRGHGVHGWDAQQGCFFAYWFDNSPRMPQHGSRATLTDNRYTYQQTSANGCLRFIYQWSDGIFTFRIERSADGQAWSPMQEGRYQRTA